MIVINCTTFIAARNPWLAPAAQYSEPKALASGSPRDLYYLHIVYRRAQPVASASGSVFADSVKSYIRKYAQKSKTAMRFWGTGKPFWDYNKGLPKLRS